MALGREYGKLWAGSAVSNLGDGASYVAIPLLAATLTGNPTLVAGLSLAYTTPRLLVSVLSGALVDRSDRRRLLYLVNSGRAAAMGFLGLATALGFADIWTLYGVFVVLGVLETVSDISAFSILPSLVGKEELSRANSRLSGAQLVCDEFAGPPLGGLMFAVAAALPVFLDAFSFAAAAAVFALLRGDFTTHTAVSGDRVRIATEVAEGVRWMGRHRVLRALAVMLALTSVAYMLPFSVLVLFARQTLHLDPAGYGLMLSASAFGGLLGAAAATPAQRLLGPGRCVSGSLLVGALACAVIATSSSPIVVTAMLAMYFFYATVWGITVAGIRQSLVPDELRGRAAGTTKTLGLLGLTLGALLGGLLAARWGLRSTFWCSAALLAVTGAAFLPVVTDRRIRESSPGTVEPELV